MSAKTLDRRFLLGLAFLAFLAALIYFSGKSEHRVAVEIKPITVHLDLSEHVKRRLSETGAALGVRAIVSDKEVNSSPLESTVLDHREQVIKPGEDTARFEGKVLELDVPKVASGSTSSLDPTLTFSVVTRMDQPTGNCIRCESPILKASSLKEGENRIEIKCDGWLEMGVCVWQKQNQNQNPKH